MAERKVRSFSEEGQQGEEQEQQQEDAQQSMQSTEQETAQYPQAAQATGNYAQQAPQYAQQAAPAQYQAQGAPAQYPQAAPAQYPQVSPYSQPATYPQAQQQYAPAPNKTPSGIPGFDDITEGGYETGSINLVAGPTGCGKTTFIMQFLHNGAAQYNEPGVLISFEEPKDSIYAHMQRFGWDFAALEEQGLFAIITYKPHEVKKLIDEGGGFIWDAISSIGAKRLVVDSLSSYSMLFESPYTAREAEIEFFELLRKWGCTTVLSGAAEKNRISVGVDYLADSIAMMHNPRRKNSRLRAIEVLKMRGANHSQKLCPFEFVDGEGLHIYPAEDVFYEIKEEGRMRIDQG